MVAGLAVGMAVVLSARAYAYATVRHVSVGRGLASALSGYSPVGGFAEMLLVLPLAVMGLLAATLQRRRGRLAASVAMVVGVTALQALYAHGFASVECLLLARKWTAASLSPMFLLLAALVIVAVTALAIELVATIVLRLRRP